MNKEDLFYKLINEGRLKISGSDKNNQTYRVIQFKGKEFKLTLEVLK